MSDYLCSKCNVVLEEADCDDWKCPVCGEYYHVSCFEDDEDDSEGLSVYDAALIWASNGKDEDYTFGYSEDELEAAL